MIVLLCIFIIVLIGAKKHSPTPLFLILQILSLLCAYLIASDYELNYGLDFFNLIIIAALTVIIILPWNNFDRIDIITSINTKKIKKLTTFLLYINFFTSIFFIITIIIVNILVSDINEFKYSEGVAVDFFYTMLPFNVKLLILAFQLYPLSYFLIPLHFYFLSKGDNKRSILCFIFSLNSVLYGMTFFSRAVYIHYILIYLGMLIIMRGTLSVQLKKIIKKAIIIIILITSFSFISITLSRFSGDDSFYSERINKESPIKDPALYGLFDYLAQWSNHGMTILSEYKGETFKGQITLQPALSLLGQYKIIKYDTDKYNTLKRKLWPKHYYTFNGYAPYVVYDFGYIGAFAVSILYAILVFGCRPRNGKISIEKLFYIVLLIQLPLMAIFYSTLSTIIFTFLYLIPIILYLKFKIHS